jgi:hypothetical protein
LKNELARREARGQSLKAVKGRQSARIRLAKDTVGESKTKPGLVARRERRAAGGGRRVLHAGTDSFLTDCHIPHAA